MKEEEGDGTSSDSTDQEFNNAAPSNSKVSSSTNGTGTGVSVISSPLRRTLEAAEAAARAHIVSNALVALGTEVVAAAAAAAVSSPIAFPGGGGDPSRLFLADFGSVRNVASHHSGSNSKSNSSDGSNSTSPLSLSISGMTKPGPKPRAADSPGSGSTTSTTTGPGGRDKVFVCQVCNRCFGYKHVLQNHERTHTGEKPFECGECHKRFTRDHHLKTHMRLHTGEKPYHCTHCERQFVQVANLRRHLRVHTGERPYACELCTSRFSDSNQLKAHMLIHKGEKPFECKKCLGRFRRRHHLMHHKCPKDEANLGKPRRGRRPKAYDQLGPAAVLLHHAAGSGDEAQSFPGVAAATVSSSTAALAAAATSSFFHIQSSVPVPSSVPVVPVSVPAIAHPSSGASSVVLSSSGSSSKSRRKQRHTIRILTPQQRELFLRDRETMQTQPLNMSLSPSLEVRVPRASYVTTSAGHSSRSHDDVLDLSRSRSDVDSEAEAIEEEVMEDDMEDDDLDDPYDSDHYNDDGDQRSMPHQVTRNSHNSRITGVSLAPRLRVVPEKILSSTAVSEDIIRHHRRRLDEHSNDGNGNGGVDSTGEEDDSDENEAIPLPLTTKQGDSVVLKATSARPLQDKY